MSKGSNDLAPCGSTVLLLLEAGTGALAGGGSLMSGKESFRVGFEI
jgi:hypothetical protein